MTVSREAEKADEALAEQMFDRAFALIRSDRDVSQVRVEMEALLQELAGRVAEVGEAPKTRVAMPIEGGDRWAERALDDLAKLDLDAQVAWYELLTHRPPSNRGEPSRAWLDEAGCRLEAVGRRAFRRLVVRWLGAIDRRASGPIPDANQDLLKGLAWYCCLFDDPAIARALADAAVACFRSTEMGLRASRAGKACLMALGSMPGPGPVAHLARIRHRITSPWALDEVRKALEGAARKAGVPPEELEELAIPDYELDEHGTLRETLGDTTAEVRVDAAGRVELTWRDAGGRPRRSAPAELRRRHAKRLESLQQRVREIRQMLRSRGDRLERMLRTGRDWPLATWRQRYLEHRLVGRLARRLIWRFYLGARCAIGIWHEGGLVDVDGRPLDGPAEAARVRPWHPIDSDPELVLRWRVWLEDHGVVQPFKQAHREVYLLTDAEQATRTYSNRFAAHLLRRGQFGALARQRGWTYEGLSWSYDAESRGASLPFPECGLLAEFWVEPVENGDRVGPSGDLAFVATDQVRFCDPADREPRPLEGVPAPVFSEVMRDVDLFVGVAGVGNDPTWQDRGDATGHGGYRQGYAFGDLSATAATRRDVLGRLLPRLKIAARCRIEGRFLVVRGDLRAYKIHLGSGNILMEPDDQYLCIVPDRRASAGAEGSVFLPFEGDPTLSRILSKAFLLAGDATIKDPSITGQIGGR